jgi:hypothetical protein
MLFEQTNPPQEIKCSKSPRPICYYRLLCKLHIYPKKQYKEKNTKISRDQCCGSGIRCFFIPWIRDPDLGCSGSRISDPVSGPFFGEIFLQKLQNPDPVSGPFFGEIFLQ